MPVAPPPRRADYDDDGQPWWIWLLAGLAVVLLGAIGFLAAQLLGSGDPNASPTPSVAVVTVPDCEGVALTTLPRRDGEVTREDLGEVADALAGAAA